MREKIVALLQSSGDLPTLPDIVIKLNTMIRDPQSNAKAIAKLIEVDPVLAGRILKLSNSVYYSRSTTPITTLPLAITKIGLTTMVKLVYSLKMTMLFDKISVIDPSMFWHHSLAAAIITQSLSRRIKTNMHMQDIAYLAGLMHDIGILVFGYLIPDEYSRFIESAACAEESLEKQETRIFGIDHSELGALFIDYWWNVDKNVIEAVKYHHAPNSGIESNRMCNRTVHLANGICNNAGLTNGIDTCLSVFDEGSWDELGLSSSDVEEILADVRTSLDQATEILSQS